MKLKNKKTGEIGYPYFQNWKEITCVIVDENAIQIAEYTSLAELNEEWEDVPEEPKEPEYYWYIGYKNDIRRTKYHHISDFADNQVTATRKEIGNCFESLEEAEKALEKLKAWKRLKDKGFRFDNWHIGSISENTSNYIDFHCDSGTDWRDISEDLDILFYQGGEE